MSTRCSSVDCSWRRDLCSQLRLYMSIQSLAILGYSSLSQRCKMHMPTPAGCQRSRCHQSLLRVVICAVVPALATSSGVVDDVCSGTGVRPVLLLPGFLGVPLYDSADKYDIEWPDFDTFGAKYGPTKLDLDLPMAWDGLEQALASVGPERSADDVLPSLDGLFGNMFEFTIYRQLQRLVSSWQHPRDASLKMYYTVAWDWRRDFYAEAPRVLAALRNVHEQTGCRAIMVGHSFGGRLLYETFARYGKEAADLTAAALYASSPLHGGATHVASLSIDPEVHVNLHRPPVDTLFTYPSVYTLAPTAALACRNAPYLLSNDTHECPEGTHPTGVNCDSPLCGRPASWPSGKPFFLPLDLQDPDVWLKIQAAQPTLKETTPEEEGHLRKALETARRASHHISGGGEAAVQKVHPPAAVVSMAIADRSLPPSPEKPAAMWHYITCTPTADFGREGSAPWCSALKRGGSIVGDGTINTFMMELAGAGWDRIIQTFRMVKPPPDWPPPLMGPHAASLAFAENSFRPLNCSHHALPNPTCSGENFPTLERVLCSLVFRADDPTAD
eukprot:jgi/Ulvmu1/1687/UM115_0016.1